MAGSCVLPNHELCNIFDKLNIPAVTLRSDLSVCCFTSSAGSILGITDANKGLWMCKPEVENAAREVIETGETRQIDSSEIKGHYYEIALAPYPADKRSELAVVTFRKIDEQTAELKEALKAAEESASLCQTLPDMFFRFDAEDRYIDYSTTVEETLFYVPPDQFLWKKLGDVLPPDAAEPLLEAMKRTRETGSVETVEYALVIRGQQTYWEARVVPTARDEIAMIVRDITERKQAENDLRENQERYRALVESINDWVWEIDEHGYYTYVSPNVIDVLGYSPEEVLNRTPFDLMPDDEAKRIAAELTRIASERRPFRLLDNYMVHKDGRTIAVQSSGAPIVDAEGKLLGFRGVNRDVTQLRRAQDALRESEEKYRTVVEKAGIGIAIAQDTVIQYANAYLAESIDYEPADVIGKSIVMFFAPDEIPKVLDIHLRRLRGEDIPPYESRVIDHAGREIPVEISGGLITYHGRPAVLAIVRNVTQQKQAEEALRESERRFRQIVETAWEGIWTIDTNARTTFVNEKMAEMLRTTREEMLQDSVFDYIFPEDVLRARRGLRRRRKGISEQLDFRFRRKDGTEMWAILAVSPIFDGDGRYIGALGMVTDVTERSEAEESLRQSEERFRLAVDSLPELLMIYDAKLRYTFINKAVYDLSVSTGVYPEEAIGHTDEELFSEETVRTYVPLLEKALWTKTTQKAEVKIPLSTGPRDFIMTYVPLLNARGEVEQIICLAEDITERKRNEEALRASEERFRLAVDNLPELLMIYDSELRYTFVNSRTHELATHSERNPEEAIGHTDEELFSEEFRQDYLPLLKKARETKLTQKGEVRIPLWIGLRDLIMTYVPLLNARGEVEQIICLGQDITERKRNEEALRESEERFRLAVDNLPDYVSIYDPDLRYQFINAAFAAVGEQVNIRPEDVIGRTDEEIFTPESTAMYMPLLKEAAQTKTMQRGEFRLPALPGLRDFIMTFVPLVGSDGNLRQIICVIQDVTEQKMREDALRESEDRFRMAVDNIPVWLYILDADLRFQFINAPVIEAARANGISPDQILGHTNEEAFPEETVRSYIHLLRKAVETRTTQKGEVHVKSIVGPAYMILTFVPLLDNDGRVYQVIGLAQDITERKRAEDAIRESEARFRLAVDNIPAWLFILDADLRFQFVNATVAEIARANGVPLDRILGHTNEEAFPEETVELYLPLLKKAVETRTTQKAEVHVETLAGAADMILTFAPLLNSEGEVYQVIGLSQDITERKRAEEAIRVSEERFRSAVNNIPVWLAIYDANLRYVFLNAPSTEFAAARGISIDQVIGHTDEDIFTEGEPIPHLPVLKKTLETRMMQTAEVRILTVPGEYVDMIVAFVPLLDSNGKVYQIIGLAQDITERKKAEEAIRRSEESARALLNATPDMALLMDVDNTIVDINEGAARLLNGTVEELVGKDVFEAAAKALPADVMAYRHSKTQQVIETGAPVRFVDRIGDRILENIYYPILDENGKVVRIAGFNTDITEQTRVEEERERSRQALQEVYERERKIAETLQRNFLPNRIPSVEGYELADAYYPALEEAAIGGDTYDIFPLPNGRVGILIADVSGKGLQASRHAAMARYMLRGFAHQMEDPGAIMIALNESLTPNLDDETFITCFFGVLLPEERRIIYANAGHDLPLCISREEVCPARLKVTGHVLGLLPGQTYRTESINMAKGDLIFFYTDGVTDARGVLPKMDIEGLEEFLHERRNLPAQELVSAVVEEVRRRSGDRLKDDVAIVALKVSET